MMVELWIGHVDSTQKQLSAHLSGSPYVLWAEREGNLYTKEQIDSLTASCQFALASHEHRVLVITHAECLSMASASSLLKLLEEPPQGWRIICTTAYPHLMLPTLLSRCIIKKHIAAKNIAPLTQPLPPYLAWLYNPDRHTWLPAAQTATRASASFSELQAHIAQLLTYWTSDQLPAPLKAMQPHMCTVLMDCHAYLTPLISPTLFIRTLLLKAKC